MHSYNISAYQFDVNHPKRWNVSQLHIFRAEKKSMTSYPPESLFKASQVIFENCINLEKSNVVYDNRKVAPRSKCRWYFKNNPKEPESYASKVIELFEGVAKELMCKLLMCKGEYRVIVDKALGIKERDKHQSAVSKLYDSPVKKQGCCDCLATSSNAEG